MRIPTVEQLEKRRLIIEADLVSKLEAHDYHGVADAAMDLREIEAQVKVLAPALGLSQSDLMPEARAMSDMPLALPSDENYFRGYVKDLPHPAMPATGTEGRCELCMLVQEAPIHRPPHVKPRRSDA